MKWKSSLLSAMQTAEAMPHRQGRIRPRTPRTTRSSECCNAMSSAANASGPTEASMADDSTTGIQDSRPIIFVGGEENPGVHARLLGLLIAEHTSGLYRCEARFSNWGTINRTNNFLYFDRRTLDFGKDFQIKLGSDSLFSGKIMGLEASFPEGRAPEISVLAEDRFQDLRMTRRTRTFSDVSDSDVINQVAN